MTSTEQQAAIDAALLDVATNEKSSTFSGESVSVTRQSVAEIIAADRHMARKNFKGLGIRCGRMTTTGASL
jgi:hypothetical protein